MTYTRQNLSKSRSTPLILPLVALFLLLAASGANASRIIEKDEKWSGRVALQEEVVVNPGVHLQIEPGTVVEAGKDVALVVQGKLTARGTPQKPIRFALSKEAAGGQWKGIVLTGGGEASTIEHVRVENAEAALVLGETQAQMGNCEVENVKKGVLAGAGAMLWLFSTRFSGVEENGVEFSGKSRGEVKGCRFEKVGFAAVAVAQLSEVMIRDNTISRAKFGVIVNGLSLGVENNAIENCELGIGISQAGPDMRINRNRIQNCEKGVDFRQFASPVFEHNTVTGCADAITCFQASNPAIRRNRIAKNKRGLVCIQLCEPDVAQNEFTENDVAVHLHLSSYAKLHENNFEKNRLHVELDNMSYDWEVRAGAKPARMRQAQNEERVRQGRAVSEEFKDEYPKDGFVRAFGNYWGKETTKEMAEKGADANISSIKDGFDEPVRTYEGWPGEYKIDKVRYDGWKKEKIKDAGPE